MTQYTAEERQRAMRMASEMRAMSHSLPKPIRIEASAFDLFRIVGYLQLAWRHPGLDQDQRETIERFARQLQDQLTSGRMPEVALVLEQGWSKEYDR